MAKAKTVFVCGNCGYDGLENVLRVTNGIVFMKKK